MEVQKSPKSHFAQSVTFKKLPFLKKWGGWLVLLLPGTRVAVQVTKSKKKSQVHIITRESKSAPVSSDGMGFLLCPSRMGHLLKLYFISTYNSRNWCFFVFRVLEAFWCKMFQNTDLKCLPSLEDLHLAENCTFFILFFARASYPWGFFVEKTCFFIFLRFFSGKKVTLLVGQTQSWTFSELLHRSSVPLRRL